VKVIASYNIKGGVGKTAAAVNLSYLAAAEGAATLVWDLDPQGAASFYFRIKPKIKMGGYGLLRRKRSLDKVIKATDYPNLDLVPADFSYRNMDRALQELKKPRSRLHKMIRPMAKEYDYVFLDCPPSISLLSENVFRAADVLLIPTIPTTLSLRTLQQLAAFTEQEGYDTLDVLPFFSMFDNRKKMHRAMVAHPPQRLGQFLDHVIPNASIVEQMGTMRAPVEVFARSSPAAGAYRGLWQELKSRL
jgi:chromosome partitioning protein